MDSPEISKKLRMMSVLRLARSRRRMHGNVQKAFEQDSALWTGLTLLGSVPDALAMEYVEELACNITKTEKTQKGKKKETEEGTQHKKMSDIGTAIPSLISPGLFPQADDNKSDEEGPWGEKLVLSFDGGGVSAISSLLILKRIMYRIRDLEIIHPEGPAFSSRSIGDKYHSALSDSKKVDEYLPCHYFDYMAGTSTGGLSSIVLGRLRMSVDQAIDNLIDFCNGVFRDPLADFDSTHVHVPAKYSTDKTCEALKTFIMSGIIGETNDISELENIATKEPFMKRGRRTRTIAFSIRNEDGIYHPHIWRSYNGPDSQTSVNRSAMIWEIARATSANRGYFEAIKINGANLRISNRDCIQLSRYSDVGSRT
ncbi:hypothetical protein FMEXI_4797 [Fusarium mexicanum]|uniref:PNPLA domain-containing protein n=1 Tax=Fusarium mexicanum TaxID=751941 RepID=A0A8H5J3K7_9HYPO|nr:hypothetical protein FMEXI_4797 [Fusarium mexicanum]